MQQLDVVNYYTYTISKDDGDLGPCPQCREPLDNGMLLKTHENAKTHLIHEICLNALIEAGYIHCLYCRKPINVPLKFTLTSYVSKIKRDIQILVSTMIINGIVAKCFRVAGKEASYVSVAALICLHIFISLPALFAEAHIREEAEKHRLPLKAVLLTITTVLVATTIAVLALETIFINMGIQLLDTMSIQAIDITGQVLGSIFPEM